MFNLEHVLESTHLKWGFRIPQGNRRTGAEYPLLAKGKKKSQAVPGLHELRTCPPCGPHNGSWKTAGALSGALSTLATSLPRKVAGW